MAEDIFTVFKSVIADDREIRKESNDLIISENSADATCQNVRIKTSSKVFCMKLDKNSSYVTNVFSANAEGVNKINDACLLFKYNSKLIVLLIELKSSSGGKNYLMQLKSGKNLIEYIINQLKLFKPDMFASLEVDFRAIRFRLPKRRKQPTKQTTRKKTNINFENRKGLLCTDLTCNKSYALTDIKKAI